MAGDFLLELEGVKGESKDSKFKESIECSSSSISMQQQGSFSSGGGGGAGKVAFHDVSFTKQIDKSSPSLFIGCATGKHYKKAVLHCRKAGGKQEEYLTVTLQDLLISSYSIGVHEGGGLPQDSFSLNFGKIEFQYNEQDANGSMKNGTPVKYDVKASKEG